MSWRSRPGGRVEPHPHRHGVDEQADHRLDPGKFGWPTGHGDAEDHIAGVGEPRQHQRPSHLHQGVDGDPTRAGAFDEPFGDLGRQPQFGGARQAGRPALGRLGRTERGGQQGGTGPTGQVLAPNPLASFRIAAGQPPDVVTVRARRHGQRGRVSPGGVQDHQLVDEHRPRPAVDHDVVGGDHQTPSWPGNSISMKRMAGPRSRSNGRRRSPTSSACTWSGEALTSCQGNSTRAGTICTGRGTRG